MLKIKKVIQDKRVLDYLLIIICLGIIIWTIIPTVYLTKYTYPVQDDFHISSEVRDMVNDGYGIISGALLKVFEYYKGFMGAYTATFLVFVFEGLINCSQPGMMIFESISILLFDIALFFFIKSVTCNIFDLEKGVVIPVYACIMTCINNVFYYADHEDYYWLDTSILYLGIFTIILLSLYMTIKLSYITVKSYYKVWLIVSCILAFLGSGANLSLSFISTALHFMIFIYLWFKGNDTKRHIPPFAAAVLGTFVNGIAPGNYVRKGSVVGMHEIVKSAYYSCRYVFERLEKIWSQPVFVVALVVMMLVLMKHSDKIAGIKFDYKWPVVVALVMYCICAAVTFPAILGYTYEILLICNRLMFIIDVMIYIMTFFMCVYFVGWVRHKYDKDILAGVKKDVYIFATLIILLSFAKLRDNVWRWTPIVRMYREIDSGRMQEFSDYVKGVYSELENSEDSVVRIEVNKVEDKCCLINPLFYYGEHENEEDFYYDNSIVRFYGKDSLILIDLEPEEE